VESSSAPARGITGAAVGEAGGRGYYGRGGWGYGRGGYGYGRGGYGYGSRLRAGRGFAGRGYPRSGGFHGGAVRGGGWASTVAVADSTAEAAASTVAAVDTAAADTAKSWPQFRSRLISRASKAGKLTLERLASSPSRCQTVFSGGFGRVPRKPGHPCHTSWWFVGPSRKALYRAQSVPGPRFLLECAVPCGTAETPRPSRSKILVYISGDRTLMAYVIAEPCINTKDTACVDACPVDCIHPKKDDPKPTPPPNCSISIRWSASIAAPAYPCARCRPFSRSTICRKSGTRLPS
jgi:NAD-dependent dihydropyrimidine dehydrogenase PreA subunit